MKGEIMKWKKGLPVETGWYWLRHPQDPDPPRIEYVRNCAGKLALGNATLEGLERMMESEWAGPISVPVTDPDAVTTRI